jgi:hypothetical protein
MIRTLLGVGLAVAIGLAPATIGAVHTSDAASAAAAKTYANCTALHKKYPGGVAKQGVTGNKVNGKLRPFGTTPKFSTSLYNANRSLDRDKDGIACER